MEVFESQTLALQAPSTDVGATELARIAGEFRHHEALHAAAGNVAAETRAADEACKLEERLSEILGGDWRGH